MYNNGVVPVIVYGSSKWGYSNKNCPWDMVQNKAVRYYLGVHNFTPVTELTGEMGWLHSKYKKSTWICYVFGTTW